MLSRIKKKKKRMIKRNLSNINWYTLLRERMSMKTLPKQTIPPFKSELVECESLEKRVEIERG